MSIDRIDKLYDRQIKFKSDRLIENNKISQFIQPLNFFDLELEEITGQPGYEDKNKVIVIKKRTVACQESCVLTQPRMNCLIGQNSNLRIRFAVIPRTLKVRRSPHAYF